MKQERHLLFQMLVSLLTVVAAIVPYFTFSQSVSRIFRVEDGLPSNLIYSFAQDRKGLLWISTDNGVARFDGKYFRIFNTHDGLPDNEVLEVQTENDGTIWVNTFKEGPCYFDERTSRFVNPLKNEDIDKDYRKTIFNVKSLDDGGIVFYSGDKELVFKNRRLVKTTGSRAFSYKKSNKDATLVAGMLHTEEGVSHYVYYTSGNKKDSIKLFSAGEEKGSYLFQKLRHDTLYALARTGSMYIINYDEAASKFNIKTIKINDEPLLFRLTDKRINISSASGKVYVYNINTLQEHYSIGHDYFANCIWEDNKKNIWAGTLNNGMIMYKLNRIESFQTKNAHIDDNLLSIASDKNGKLFAGNYKGEILESNKNAEKIYWPIGNKIQLWIRKIIPLGGKVFAFSENGIFVNYKRKVRSANNDPISRIKDAAVLNDSIIIAAGVNVSHGGGLYKINVYTEKATQLPSNIMRISEVDVDSGRYIYCGTNEGLIKYDYRENRVVNEFRNTPFYDRRITGIEVIKENLACVATSIGDLFILHNDKIIAKLDGAELASPSINVISATPNKSVWVGTRSGLSRIAYTLNNNLFEYKIHNFSRADGLPANIINDITNRNDTVFLATEKGIAFMPQGLVAPIDTIYTYLTDIKINHERRPLNENNTYNLNYDERSVLLEFSGVNLSGHLKKLEYTFDTTKGWTDIDADDLSLELGTGTRKIYVRSVSFNTKDNPVLTLTFNVHTPLYMQIWFLILAAAASAGLAAYIALRIKTVRQKGYLQNRLKIEEERNRITADLHDDIGSTLSSLQIYSDIAYSVIDADKEKAKGLLQRVATGISKISDSISDIIWSMKGDQVYALTLSSRIKNIVSDVLGPTEINYQIHIDDGLDKKITSISGRKNTILVVKETINNIVKYSNATEVLVNFLQKDNYGILVIKDNGIGMNLEKSFGKGNGLLNMKKRMQEIGGKIEITSEPDQGVEIVCSIPLS